MYNSIYWNNQDYNNPGTISATIYEDIDSKIELTNSIIESSGGSGTWVLDPTRYVDGGGNKDTDPLFITPIDPTNAPTAEGDLRLTKDSPAIDMGKNDFVTTLYDLDNKERIVDGDLNGTVTVDMGAYEYQIPYIYDINLPIIIQ